MDTPIPNPISNLLARQFREACFGGSFTAVSLLPTLEAVPWARATHKPAGRNSVVSIAWHLHFYIRIVTRTLLGGPLEGKDRDSWETPAFETEASWHDFLRELRKDAEEFARAVEATADAQWPTPFVDDRYGSWFRNVQGVNEHLHYHLGQIVILHMDLQAEEGR